MAGLVRQVHGGGAGGQAAAALSSNRNWVSGTGHRPAAKLGRRFKPGLRLMVSRAVASAIERESNHDVFQNGHCSGDRRLGRDRSDLR
ncbi:hypothetical protein BQ8794_330079 [Mesorhizobium prunaredense]|uniref:Uncharacterized protein n=1 Tax=Mesorhizobium prunaredense TaxID=1631249 RepID=A0A1R3VBW7_9HYPH|nr:hypothetical protein BQ8794_330079 [Mesorhizobium prunaredense]